MHKVSRLGGGTDAIEVDFVEREAMSFEIMDLAIHLDLGGLSLSILFLYLIGLGQIGLDRPSTSGYRTTQFYITSSHASPAPLKQ
jgi:hypothetical protein